MNDLERDLREMYQRREADLREPRFAPPHAPEQLLGRTRRHQVAVVLAALTVATVVAIGSTAGAMSLLRSSDRLMPANPSESSLPGPGGLVRASEMYERGYAPAAWGGVDRSRWTLWTSGDLRCMAFLNDNRSDQGCSDAYDGSDLMRPTWCAYACPVPGQPIFYGVVSIQVARVELVMDDGTTYVGIIHPPPPDISVDARVFTVATDRRWGAFPATLRAMTADGKVLGQIRYPRSAGRG